MSDIKLEKKKIIRELVAKQLVNVPPHRRLLYKDLCRISRYIHTSIASEEDCCIWNGYVTNTKNSRGSYINFFFRNKKVALHRLLYENFVGELNDNYYIKFSCECKDSNGTCCNINHMIKYKYNTQCENVDVEKKVTKKSKKNKIYDEESFVKDKITLSFD